MSIVIEPSRAPALHRLLVVAYAATLALSALVLWIEMDGRVSGPLVAGLTSGALLVWGMARGSILAWRIAVATAVLGLVMGFTNIDEPLGWTQIGGALVQAALLLAMRQKGPFELR